MKPKPIIGELCRYQVQSATRPNESYIVDLLEDECGCRDWVCRHSDYQRAHHKKYRCRHILQLREYFLDEVLESLREQALSR